MASINKETLNMIETKLKEGKPFSEIEKEFGISIKFAGGTYNTAGATIKIEIKSVDENILKDNFKRLAEVNFVNPEWYGKTFKYDYEEYKVVEIDPKARKYCIVCLNLSNNRKYGFTIDSVKEHLNDKDYNPFKGTKLTVHESDGSVNEVIL